MGIEVEASCTPRVEQKIVSAGTTNPSYAQASEQLESLAELEIGSKRTKRITQRVGNQRVKQREQAVKDYDALPLPQQQVAPSSAPQGSWDRRVAVVMVDGGRAQLRDERWNTPRMALEKRRGWWRESKLALLVTFASERHETDPMPEVPECLLDPLWLVPLINDMKAARGGEAAVEGLADDQELLDLESAETITNERWSPEPLVRSVVATFEPYNHLGKLAEVEAYQRGFTSAKRRAFVADGLTSNWTLHKKRFSNYVPILDLMHALSYVYQAAQASACDMEECWQRSKTWITLVWQGEVAQVIRDIESLIETSNDESVLEKLHESRGYLSNNASRMKYAWYRREGLPLTSALMESTIKQGSRRMKGTEKFWGEGAEAQLQLCADMLSETKPLDEFWKIRSESQTGHRKSRTNQ